MSKAEEFLDLYSRVEELLEERLGQDNNNQNNVIIRYCQTRPGRRFKKDLTVCREVRNILSHHSDIKGQAVVEPADALLEVLRKVIDDITQPPLALDFATAGQDVFMATPSRYVLPLMRTMQEKGFSHIPVWENNRMVGVFSRDVIFRFTLDHPEEDITEETEISHFAQYLPPQHAERYLFAPPSLTYWEAKDAFNQVRKNQSLAAIFITDTGKDKGRLLGMLTPWDVLGNRKR